MAVKAKRDPLTGAFNRDGVEESLVDALNDWHVSASHLSIVLLDVDHFKNVNDSFGHAVGDRILIEISALVGKNIRNGDRFARWGARSSCWCAAMALLIPWLWRKNSGCC